MWCHKSLWAPRKYMWHLQVMDSCRHDKNWLRKKSLCRTYVMSLGATQWEGLLQDVQYLYALQSNPIFLLKYTVSIGQEQSAGLWFLLIKAATTALCYVCTDVYDTSSWVTQLSSHTRASAALSAAEQALQHSHLHITSTIAAGLLPFSPNSSLLSLLLH